MTSDAEQASVAPPTAREGFFDPRADGDGAERLRDLEFRYPASRSSWGSPGTTS
jgi:hypothetical protein